VPPRRTRVHMRCVAQRGRSNARPRQARTTATTMKVDALVASRRRSMSAADKCASSQMTATIFAPAAGRRASHFKTSSTLPTRCARYRRTFRASFLGTSRLLKIRGRRESTGARRAPPASRAMKKAHEHRHHGKPNITGSPRRHWFSRLTSRFPGDQAC